MERSVPFLYLAKTIRDEDERQDAIVLLLEENPATEVDAQATIARVSRSKRKESRQRPLQLSIDPCTDQLATSGIHAAIALLPDAERELINRYYISGMTVRAIAERSVRSVAVTHEALSLAVRKLTAILQRKGEQTALQLAEE